MDPTCSNSLLRIRSGYILQSVDITHADCPCSSTAAYDQPSSKSQGVQQRSDFLLCVLAVRLQNRLVQYLLLSEVQGDLTSERCASRLFQGDGLVSCKFHG